MDELATTISQNLSALRKSRHLTQQELAEQIGYSDKSISKWELGKAIPSVDILLKFAEFYGVTLNDLVATDGAKKVNAGGHDKKYRTNKIVITAMACTFILFAAVAIYVNAVFSFHDPKMWVIFVWSIPLMSLIAAFLIHRFFGRQVAVWILLSIFLWTLLLSVALTFYLYLDQNIFFILLVGIPVQISIILLAQLK